MSRTTISTGNISFNTNDEQNSAIEQPKKPCHIAIIANFSGRKNHALDNESSIKQQKIIEVDRDNFDEVFSQLNVRCTLPLAEKPIHFEELDDMHPDFIYERVPLFDNLRSLRKRLKNPKTFDEAAKEVYQWYESSPIHSEATKTTTKTIDNATNTSNDSLLDNLLAEATVEQSSSRLDIQAIMKDIISPYVIPKPDPKQNELLQAVDDATSDLMRKILHHSNFQNIESTWRSLDKLIRRIETNGRLKLFLIDITQHEVINDSLNNNSLEQSELYKLLVSNRASVGSTPFSLIMHDTMFGYSTDDLKGLAHIGAIASSCNAIAIASGTEQLAGCQSLHQTPDIDDWNFTQPPEITEQWEILRSQPQADSIILAAPRFLCRMPYGQKTSPIDSFYFEELPANNKHPYYLWSNGAWLIILLFAQNYSITGHLHIMKLLEIDRLPLHVFTDDGEPLVTPCAEVNMLDSAAIALQEAGLTTIRSIQNKDAVIIPKLVSIQK
ncbi:type VI secretion system contractile sheath domain-containing protein [Aliikangiella sp. IMCC44359]|uniref:type VI secretion system contractile sheath domain-containing protein n=1 Tax=Aliikangiella sp. IMCC44359 TaxID=3459125 RepID=UPI00403AA0F0